MTYTVYLNLKNGVNQKIYLTSDLSYKKVKYNNVIILQIQITFPSSCLCDTFQVSSPSRTVTTRSVPQIKDRNHIALITNNDLY